MRRRSILVAGTILLLAFFVAEVAQARRKPPMLYGVWTDIWRDKIFLWQEDNRLIGAYTWAGAPAALIGVIEKKTVTLRYYQVGGRDGEARCFIEDKGTTLNCRYVAVSGEETGQWMLKKISDSIPNR